MSDPNANDNPIPSIETNSGSGLDGAKNSVVNSKVGDNCSSKGSLHRSLTYETEDPSSQAPSQHN
jgi:hypothetical protein